MLAEILLDHPKTEELLPNSWGEQDFPIFPTARECSVRLQKFCPSSVGFGEPVDACRHHQLMLPDLPLQEGLQLVDVHLRDDGSRGDEHPQHGVDAVQRHAVQVCQHGLDVGPEQLQGQNRRVRFFFSHCASSLLCVCVCVCVCVHLQLLLPLLWLGGGVGVSLLVAVDQHHASLHLLFGRARLHHVVASSRLLPQHAVLLPQSQLPVHQLLRGAQFHTELLQSPRTWWSTDSQVTANFTSTYIFKTSLEKTLTSWNAHGGGVKCWKSL